MAQQNESLLKRLITAPTRDLLFGEQSVTRQPSRELPTQPLQVNIVTQAETIPLNNGGNGAGTELGLVVDAVSSAAGQRAGLAVLSNIAERNGWIGQGESQALLQMHDQQRILRAVGSIVSEMHRQNHRQPSLIGSLWQDIKDA